MFRLEFGFWVVVSREVVLDGVDLDCACREFGAICLE